MCVPCCDRFMAKTRNAQQPSKQVYDFGWPLLRSILPPSKKGWEGRINIWISDHPIRPPATPFFMTPCNPRLKRTVRLSLKVSRAKKGKNYWLDLIGAPSSPVPAWLVCLGSFLLATNCSFLLTMLHSQLLLYSCHTGPIWTFKNVLTIHMICIFESVLGFLRMYLYLPLKKYWHRKECIARFQIPIEFFLFAF